MIFTVKMCPSFLYVSDLYPISMGKIPKILLRGGHSIIEFIDINKIYWQHVVMEESLDGTHYHEQKNYDEKSHGMFREIIKHFLCQSFKYEISSDSMYDWKKVPNNGEIVCCDKELGNLPYSKEEPQMGIWNDHVCILLEESVNCRNDGFDKSKVKRWPKWL